MTDNEVGIDEQAEAKEEDVQPVANPEAIKLDIDVKEGIQTQQESGVIRTRVVESLVEEEVTLRADLLAKALAKRKAQAKELGKIKPDQCGFNEDGSPAFAHWTKPKLKEKQAAEKTLNKIDKAINSAINNADYEGVKKITQG